MSRRVKTSARALVLTRSSQPESGHLRRMLVLHLLSERNIYANIKKLGKQNSVGSVTVIVVKEKKRKEKNNINKTKKKKRS